MSSAVVKMGGSSVAPFSGGWLGPELRLWICFPFRARGGWAFVTFRKNISISVEKNGAFERKKNVCFGKKTCAFGKKNEEEKNVCFQEKKMCILVKKSGLQTPGKKTLFLVDFLT